MKIQAQIRNQVVFQVYKQNEINYYNIINNINNRKSN